MTEVRMTAQEFAPVLRMIAATWPSTDLSQKEIAANWYLHLCGFRAVDIEEAVRNIATQVSFAEIAAIVTEVKRLRGERANRHHGAYFKPSRGDLSHEEERAELLAFNRALADGEDPPRREELTRQVDVLALTSGGLPSMDEADRPARPGAPGARARALARYRSMKADQEASE